MVYGCLTSTSAQRAEGSVAPLLILLHFSDFQIPDSKETYHILHAGKESRSHARRARYALDSGRAQILALHGVMVLAVLTSPFILIHTYWSCISCIDTFVDSGVLPMLPWINFILRAITRTRRDAQTHTHTHTRAHCATNATPGKLGTEQQRCSWIQPIA